MKFSNLLRVWCAVLALLFHVNPLKAEIYEITRINSPIDLDGVSDEPAWQNISPLPVIMQEPQFDLPPTERTEILLAYDEQYLYAAGRLYDSQPGQIQSLSKKRDEMNLNNDWFGLVLDTFNDKENALAFFTTPSGLRLDMTVENDAQGRFPLNRSWNTFWDVKTVRNEQGWFVEMRIPFSSLRFQQRNGRVVMGLITWRWIARKNELDVFPRIPQDWGFWGKFKPSQAQQISFNDLPGHLPLYVTPYLLAGQGISNSLNDEESAYVQSREPAFDIGLDVKYGLTSNLTLDITANTDFAQVEADDEQVNLTRFSLFFPEKRLFFQERSSNFEFKYGGPNRLFYSRKIGIADGQRVRIYGGARLVGRIGGWDVGLLDMQTAASDSLASENFGVLRLRRQALNENTYFGAILTNRMDRKGAYNTAVGLDGVIRLYDDDYLLVQLANTFEDQQESAPVSLKTARLNVNWERRTLKGLGYDISLARSGAEYNPAMGFEQREDYTRYRGRYLYGWMPGREAALLRHQAYLMSDLIWRNAGGRLETMTLGPEWQFLTKSGYDGSIEARYIYEDVPDSFSISDKVDIPAGSYTFNNFEIRLSTPNAHPLNVRTRIKFGRFYDGRLFSSRLNTEWSVNPSLKLSAEYEYNHVSVAKRDQILDAHIARIRTVYMFSTALTASAFVQWNSTGKLFLGNFRLRWNPREGNDFYLVYDEGRNYDRFRERPVYPMVRSRTLLVKYNYTFQL